nr:presenilins-associated rhomboid-like protein, mitochondrial isoform X2 [Dermatophagoides farinae]
MRMSYILCSSSSLLHRQSINKLNLISKLRFIHQNNQQHVKSSIINKYGKLVKPFLFTITACGASFTIATIAQYENDQNDFHRKQKRFQSWNPYNSHQELSWFQQMKNLYWDSRKDGFKIFCCIAALNGLAFLCWRIPRLNPLMTKYFISRIDTGSIRIAPMILSNFSHYSITHLAMNMIVLYSFCDLGVHLFGRENFLALYLNAGIISSFASFVHKVIINSTVPSLGASGAILGVLGATCLERPDIQLMIIFLPFFTFSSYTALKSILLLDALGIILRWEFFDHAAHMGGTLFGM